MKKVPSIYKSWQEVYNKIKNENPSLLKDNKTSIEICSPNEEGVVVRTKIRVGTLKTYVEE
jgi:hypothetical protein